MRAPPLSFQACRWRPRNRPHRRLRPQIDDVVGRLNHIKVVFDHKQRTARFDQRAKCRKQFVDIVKVQAGGRLVKDVKRFAPVRLRR